MKGPTSLLRSISCNLHLPHSIANLTVRNIDMMCYLAVFKKECTRNLCGHGHSWYWLREFFRPDTRGAQAKARLGIGRDQVFFPPRLYVQYKVTTLGGSWDWWFRYPMRSFGGTASIPGPQTKQRSVRGEGLACSQSIPRGLVETTEPQAVGQTLIQPEKHQRWTLDPSKSFWK